MESKYDPNAPWPIAVLAKFFEVRDCRGYHEIYKNGLAERNAYEPNLSQMGHIPTDWICRVFMFRTNMNAIGAVHLIYSDHFFGKVEIRRENGEDIVSLQKNGVFNAVVREVLVSHVKVGDIFSFGLRINKHRDFIGLANNVSSRWSAQGTIKPSDYRFKIWQSNHVLLSIHITQEDVETTDILYPPAYLGTEYAEKPPGSRVVALLEFTHPDREVHFGVTFDNVNATNYGKRTDLPAYSLIYVYLVNWPKKYVISTSFDPVPRPLLHSDGSGRRINFYYNDSTSLLSITHHII